MRRGVVKAAPARLWRRPLAPSPLFPPSAGKNIQFHDSEGKVGATLPMAALTAAVQPGNNDVELQFTTDDTVNRDDEALVEMRLWVPPGHAQLAAAAAEAGPTPSGELPTPAAMLQKQVMEGAGLTSVSGEVIAEFDEKVSMFLTPRGRYAIELYGTFMRMVGKTNEFKVSYSTIARISYLRRPSPTSSSTPRYSLVISLDDPVKHGQQRYAHLVMQVDDVPHTCTVNADAETRSKKFAGIDEKVSGNLPKVMAIVLKSITGKKVYRPSKFKSALGHSCVKCALSSSDGLLYPLDKSFFFIHKPATFIRFSEVSFVEFQRTGQASVTFDIHIACKSVGSEPGRDFTFKAIDAREKEPFASFVKERGLKLIMEQAPATMASSAAGADAGADGKDPVFGDADESDSDDEDFEGGDSPSSEGESDSEDDGSGGSGGGDSDDSDASGAEGGHKRARGGEGSSPSSAKKARTDA